MVIRTSVRCMELRNLEENSKKIQFLLADLCNKFSYNLLNFGIGFFEYRIKWWVIFMDEKCLVN